MRSLRLGTGSAALLMGSLLLQPKTTWAETGFALNRFEPSEAGGRWVTADSLNIEGHLKPSFGVVSDWAHKPFVVYTGDSDERVAVAEDQLFVHVQGSLSIADYLRVGVSAPVTALQRGNTVLIGQDSFQKPEKTGIGDVRVSADLRLLGKQSSAATVAVGTAVYLPTGDPSQLTGDGAVRIRPRLQAAGQVGNFVYALRGGAHIRTGDSEFAGEDIGSEMFAGGSLGVLTVDQQLLTGISVAGSTELGEDVFRNNATPVEFQVEAQYNVTPEWKLGAAVGPGLGRGIGVPATRVLLAVNWYPTPALDTIEPAPEPEPASSPPLDTDVDGIVDAVDACPEQAGVRTDEPATNGCPAVTPPADRDGDGVVDAMDACPEQAGIAQAQGDIEIGCPLPADTDGDGIPDDSDACPEKAPRGLADLSRPGCPFEDADGDGIRDDEDACPNEVGVQSSDDKRNGCARVIVGEKSIEIRERIEFASGGSELTAASQDILQGVLQALIEHPEIQLISVEGHTDSRGSFQTNQRLSKARARAIVAWLVAHGIENARLQAVGHGESKPIASNDTDDGRQTNRRVEFVVEKRNK